MRTWILGMAVVGHGAAAEVPRVAVDIAPVHSIVAAVMGKLGAPDLIVPPSASPHGYSLRPSEARALDKADIVVWVGHGLAPWMSGPIDSLAGDAQVIELLSHPSTNVLDIREGATFAAHDHDHGHEEDHDDHADHDEDHHDDHGHDDDRADHDEHADHDGHGDDEHKDHTDHAQHDEHAEHNDQDGHDDHADAHDDHGSLDPHVWLDPDNAIAWAGMIADALSEKDPDNAGAYSENATNFTIKINELKVEVDAMLDPVRGRPFVVFHDAYHYFEHHFDVEAVGAVSDTGADAPSPARVAELRDEIADLNAVCALTEPQFNPGILDALGAARLGEIDPIGVTLAPGPDLYPQLLRNMASTLAVCLE